MNNIDDDIDFELSDIINTLSDDDFNNISSIHINKLKQQMLEKIPFQTENDKTKIQKRLRSYKFVDEIDELKLGGYYQWINIKNIIDKGVIKLTAAGFLYDYDTSADGTDIVLKVHGGNSPHNRTRYGRLRCTKVRMHNVMLFQKLTQQEEILIKIMDYVQGA
jgi:hypothetical protein